MSFHVICLIKNLRAIKKCKCVIKRKKNLGKTIQQKKEIAAAAAAAATYTGRVYFGRHPNRINRREDIDPIDKAHSSRRY